MIDGQVFLGGPTGPGTLLLAAWAVAVVVSWRLRHRALLRLHALLAVMTVVAVGSAGRIFGPPWAYLALWTWGLAAVLVVAIGWTAAALLALVTPAGARPKLAMAGTVALALIVLGGTARFAMDAADVQPHEPELSQASAHIVPRTISVLAEGSLPGTGRDGRYLVSWDDPRYQGGRGFILFNELDRAGFDVGAKPLYRTAVTRHRVRPPEEATAHVHLAVGPQIDEWAARPGFRPIASYDPVDDVDTGELAELRAGILDTLRATGDPDLVEAFEDDPASLVNDEAVPAFTRGDITRLVRQLEEVVVFVGPPTPST